MTEVTLNEVLNLATQLFSVDKVRLMQHILTEIEQALMNDQEKPRRSLWGLCADLRAAPSAEDIDEARREIWANFPRGDI